MTKLRNALLTVNAWQIRIVALSFLVIGIGSGSQFLVNALAVGVEPEVQNVQTTIMMIPPTPTVHTLPTIIHLRRAGVDSLGGFTVAGKR